MCALYTISPNLRKFEIGSNVLRLPAGNWPDRIFPGSLAPVFIESASKLMRFSLIPSWSKDPNPMFATHNARIETVLEKPTWRKPFEKNHCLIPIDKFIEPIREGEYKGHMVRFSSEIPLLAAGIYDEWINKETGEIIESFSILTKEPTPFVSKIGHDRQPIFLLNQNDQREWLENQTKSSLEWQQLLIEAKNQDHFEIEIDRKLKS